jgi:hypothetical protein
VNRNNEFVVHAHDLLLNNRQTIHKMAEGVGIS